MQCNQDLCTIYPEFWKGDNEESSASARRNLPGDEDKNEDEDGRHSLEKRGGEDMIFRLLGRAEIRRRANWPSRGELYATPYRRQNVSPWYYRMANRRDCPDSTIERIRVDPYAPSSSLPARLQTDHSEDVSD